MNTTTSLNPAGLHYAVQCLEKTSGKIADFVFHIDAPFVAVSPLFDSLQDLFRWLHARGLESDSLRVKAIALPPYTRLVEPSEAVVGGDYVLWSRNPRDAWTAIVSASPFVGQTPDQIGCCIVRPASK